nr:immunoglobulin heavy chain junction region [Macaca mulatta]MOV52366.1 immunoglobulin heavy chain junction region [Macaca mulatta]
CARSAGELLLDSW